MRIADELSSCFDAAPAAVKSRIQLIEFLFKGGGPYNDLEGGAGLIDIGYDPVSDRVLV